MGESEYPDSENTDLVRLLDEPEVYLWRNGETALEDRLVGAFRRTWRMIPPDAAIAITRYWQPSPAHCPGRVIIFEAGCGRTRDGVPAITLNRGHRIEFHREAVARCTDGALIGLVAHELTHVYGHATRDASHKAEYECEEEMEAAERFVDRVLRGWGLSEYDDELEQWLQDNSTWNSGGPAPAPG